MADPENQRGGILAIAWTRYLEKLDREPLKTKAITAAVLAGLSDIVAQKLAARKAFVERVFRGRSGQNLLLQKVALDQLTYGPLCNILLMSYVALLVEGRSLTFTKAKLMQDYPAVQLNAWKVWPLASQINYQHVPLHLRVLFANVVAFFWSTFLILRSRTALAPSSHG
ncbi:hypothetical protein WJX81_005416 [Elliptochloris bilobata]|uniref:Uncharacterized protein n=1 Tax=Elliptochloris bilobata TaxID=381761 RepID=A0AAW1RAE9_9CHLO